MPEQNHRFDFDGTFECVNAFMKLYEANVKATSTLTIEVHLKYETENLTHPNARLAAAKALEAAAIMAIRSSQEQRNGVHVRLLKSVGKDSNVIDTVVE